MTVIPGHNLMIVAHPDDEIIFGYTQLVAGFNPVTCTNRWSVLCMTNRSHPERAAEFRKIMSSMGVRPEIWDYPDQWGELLDPSCKERLARFIQEGNYDNVLTHNAQGEYGHTQHRSLHSIVRDLVPKNLWIFSRNEPLPFGTLHSKIAELCNYKSQYRLQAYDWKHSSDPSLSLMNFVVNEGVIQIA